MSSKEIDVFNLEEERKQIADEQKRERQREIDDVRKILKTPEGRRWIWKLLGECGIFRNSYTANSNQTAFNEGMRSIGLGILITVNEASTSAFSQMQQEYISAFNSKKETKDAIDNE